MNHSRSKTINLTLSAMFMALGLVLPFLTGQIPRFGSMLLPMHIPVLLCGLICGWPYGLCVGFIVPLLRSILFGMPVFYPSALAMAFELATYGAVVGCLYAHSRKGSIGTVYRSLILAMLSGRIVWGIVEVILLGIGGSAFTWQAFMAGAFINAIPGIVLQLILIPILMVPMIERSDSKTSVNPKGLAPK